MLALPHLFFCDGLCRGYASMELALFGSFRRAGGEKGDHAIPRRAVHMRLGVKGRRRGGDQFNARRTISLFDLVSTLVTDRHIVWTVEHTGASHRSSNPPDPLLFWMVRRLRGPRMMPHGRAYPRAPTRAASVILLGVRYATAGCSCSLFDLPGVGTRARVFGTIGCRDRGCIFRFSLPTCRAGSIEAIDFHAGLPGRKRSRLASQQLHPNFFFSVHPRSNRAARVTLPHSQSRSSRPSAKRSACMLVHTPHTHTVCNDLLQSPIQRDHGDSSEAVRWWSR